MNINIENAEWLLLTIALLVFIYQLILVRIHSRRHKESCEVVKRMTFFDIKSLTIQKDGHLEIEWSQGEKEEES